eukprot:GEMP01001735.1.p1 GENE.GEMP01001735.1~~GEMP01001735.1.p1  ORF type:complete len:1162 (+),score=278.31 GEMP01001735.1:169-3486(+)
MAANIKREGNAAFQDSRFLDAIKLFSQALVYNPFDPILYSNRSACLVKVHRHMEALDDATMCVSLDPTFAKGWNRCGVASFYLGRWADAEKAYLRGLEEDSQNMALVEALKALQEKPQRSPSYFLLASQTLNFMHLFQKLEDPEGLTEAYVEEQQTLLNYQLEYLTVTLHVDLSALFASPELRDAYDQATFACGQLLSFVPGATSRLPIARQVVQGIACALRVGWDVHHGVAKFAANALAVVALSDQAEDEVRRMAIRLLLSGMMQWLLDSRGDQKADVRGGPSKDAEEVCGCSCMRPRLSVGCWIDRLFQRNVIPPWLQEEIETFQDVVTMVIWLIMAVRDEHSNPMGLPFLLQIPAVTNKVMSSTMEIDLHDPPASAKESVKNLERPKMRVGEWVLSSLCYLMLFIDSDPFFSVQACKAILKLLLYDPGGDGLRRFFDMQLSLPFLERLCVISCHHSAALVLLQRLAKDRRVRLAMRSFAQAIMKVTPKLSNDDEPKDKSDDRAEDKGEDAGKYKGDYPRAVDEFAFSDEVRVNMDGGKAPVAENESTVGADESNQADDKVPTWAEYYHEAGNMMIKHAGHIGTIRTFNDIALCWAILEIVERYGAHEDPPGVKEEVDELFAQMGVPEKRVWLNRRLNRHHRDLEDDLAESALAFVECDRGAASALSELRRQMADGTGLFGDISGEFEVRFQDESSVGSAVLREWMDHVGVKAFLDPNNRMMIEMPDHTYCPDPLAPFVNPNWRRDYEMLGRLIGLAIFHNVSLQIPLHTAVCRLLFGIELPQERQELFTLVESVLPDTYASHCKFLLSQPISMMGVELHFVDVLDHLSTPLSPAVLVNTPDASDDADIPIASSTALLPSLPEVAHVALDKLPGTDKDVAVTLRRYLPQRAQVALLSSDAGATEDDITVVTEECKEKYLELLTRWRLHGCMKDAVDCILKGLHSMVPAGVMEDLARMTVPSEFSQLVAGLSYIDVVNWEHNTQYSNGLGPNAPVVKWFWQVLRQWSEDDEQGRLADLLQYATGSRRVPVGGFSHLQGFNGSLHRFTLSKGSHLTVQSLPTAHACICTLDFPAYPNFEHTKQKLVRALDFGGNRFDEAAAQEQG